MISNKHTIEIHGTIFQNPIVFREETISSLKKIDEGKKTEVREITLEHIHEEPKGCSLWRYYLSYNKKGQVFLDGDKLRADDHKLCLEIIKELGLNF